VSKRAWAIAGGLLGVLLGFGLQRRARRHRHGDDAASEFHSARVYDAVVTPLFDWLYARVAAELAQRFTTGSVLEAGGGPGRLAVRLGRLAPDLTIVGVDLAPEMVERANQHFAEAGLVPRVTSVTGSVAELPFPDAHFDGAFSTLSVHHWREPERGIGELYRVLKPGAEAFIYDVPPWMRRTLHPGPELGGQAEASPFGGGTVEISRKLGIPILTRLHLRRAAAEVV
jgi:SAM-dependent methyltransferase